MIIYVVNSTSKPRKFRALHCRPTTKAIVKAMRLSPKLGLGGFVVDCSSVGGAQNLSVEVIDLISMLVRARIAMVRFPKGA